MLKHLRASDHSIDNSLKKMQNKFNLQINKLQENFIFSLSLLKQMLQKFRC